IGVAEKTFPMGGGIAGSSQRVVARHMVSLVFKNIWSSPAPSKVITFSWKLLHDRLPSKCNLHRRGVVQNVNNQQCVWCVDNLESGTHLLLHCNFAKTVWMEARNEKIFNNLSKAPKEVVEEIKGMPWRWSVHRLKITPCLLYEWQRELGYCFGR
ncbi:MYB-like transcription factor, partial [Trifolium pratense]